MYDIILRFRLREEVIERVDHLETAFARVQLYQRQGLTAYYRPTVRRAGPGATETRGAQESRILLHLREIEHDILATGKVTGPALDVLRRQLYAAGKINRPEADFLVELHRRVQHITPAFERFFYQAIKDHILADGRIDAEEVAWLQRMLFADGTIKDEERKLLRELKGEAGQVCPEFEVLFGDSMKQPQEQHTSG